MLTLGQASKTVGKSKPTISKAIKDGKLSAQKVDGVYQIEPSELLRVFPAISPQDSTPAPVTDDSSTLALALAQQENAHLTATVEDLRSRLDDMKAERDAAMDEARADRQRVVALLEDTRPRSFWSRLTGR